MINQYNESLIYLTDYNNNSINIQNNIKYEFRNKIY